MFMIKHFRIMNEQSFNYNQITVMLNVIHFVKGFEEFKLRLLLVVTKPANKNIKIFFKCAI